MENINLSEIQSLINQRKIVWTAHVGVRLRERGIRRKDVLECIANGKIIEQYPSEKGHPSCLVLGKIASFKSLHVVVGLDADIACFIVTAYYPNLDKWNTGFEKRKELL